MEAQEWLRRQFAELEPRDRVAERDFVARLLRKGDILGRNKRENGENQHF
jgi:hypothetical protein